MKFRAKLLIVFSIVLLAGFVFPEKTMVPVTGATANDWHKDSFWYEPLGSSGVHKGIDIFARKGNELVSTTNGLVLYQPRFGD